MRTILLLVGLILLPFGLSAQHKPKVDALKNQTPNYNGQALEPAERLNWKPVKSDPLRTPGSFQITPIQTMPAPKGAFQRIDIQRDPNTGLPIFIKAELKDASFPEFDMPEEKVAWVLEEQKHLIGIGYPAQGFGLVQSRQSNNQEHFRLQQYYQGIEIYGAEICLNIYDSKTSIITGRFFPEPKQLNTLPSVSKNEVIFQVKQHNADLVAYQTLNQEALEWLDGPQEEGKLIIFHHPDQPKVARLAWQVTLRPNIFDKYTYILDAQNGEVLLHYLNSCKFHKHLDHKEHNHNHGLHEDHAGEGHVINKLNGPTTANANDLFNITRTINVFEEGGTYYMIDASRSMYNAGQSDMPDDPNGVIWTIDAQNIPPDGSGNLNIAHVASSNNSWNNARGVSAHYNAAEAYEYFFNTFSRNSINGSGGNIISIINVTEDGSGMDNAFWNGQAMFYGNGNQVFNAPLCKSLDVGGHEMSHGVIQNTANLEYVGQSGALNESYADIFGAMIDRDDWQMGEDVTNASIFPTGALRDLSNPNNGGNSLNDPGWQPKNMNEYQNLPYTPQGDNGGVHVNSGIPNYAYYLFATDIGKNKAEQVYYKALTDYLTKSSQFVDARIAVVQAAKDIHGNNAPEVTAAENAFTMVGLLGGQSGTPTQDDLSTNPGQDFIIHTDDFFDGIYITETDGSNETKISNQNPISNPSITDDGSLVVFVGADKRMYAISFDWSIPDYSEFVMQDQPIWRNCAISKDGNLLAGLTDDFDNYINVFNFETLEWWSFALYNPTYTQGVSTGDVQYADILEFEHGGEWIMYDAYNEFGTGTQVDYWDVGFVKVWNRWGNHWAAGHIQKLFSGLPEDVSIGEPVFSNNSPNIVAFDYIEQGWFSNSYSILGADIETGDVGTIFNNAELGSPSFSKNDNRVIFNALSTYDDELIAVINLAPDKINSTGDATILIQPGRWGNWFSNGTRALVNTESPVIADGSLQVFPNPAGEELQISLAAGISLHSSVKITLYDQLGREIRVINGLINQLGAIDVSDLQAGMYYMKVTDGKQAWSAPFVKE